MTSDNNHTKAEKCGVNYMGPTSSLCCALTCLRINYSCLLLKSLCMICTILLYQLIFRSIILMPCIYFQSCS
ncbi:hypothetical protein KFK09_018120 [Dendrobium nobile]|uniref:Uncharacterized protein n=1 Tax=Dendrobium nobile TaxID=94219 RepID=A0A8T3AW29_DENNO|nr:hypothetical protein KFK09_018120 [Dendrobium nobile]